jgi:hypothetical protein
VIRKQRMVVRRQRIGIRKAGIVLLEQGIIIRRQRIVARRQRIAIRRKCMSVLGSGSVSHEQILTRSVRMNVARRFNAGKCQSISPRRVSDV